MAAATGRDKIPPAVRDKRLKIDDHTCQLCGNEGPKAGGVAALEVHHKQPEPAKGDRHDIKNLITLCEGCHSWAHKRPTGQELPFEITDADRKVLLPHDYQILQVLHDSGPLSTGEVQEALSLELSAIAIRERLWLLMGLDNEVASRDRPLVDQSAETGEWGLPNQIAESERGRIPEDMQTLIRRVHDERVRRALERGCDRSIVIEVLDIAERTSWYKQRRAQAYDFPLSGLERGDSADSRDEQATSETSTATEAGEATADQETADEDKDQQRLDTLLDSDASAHDETAAASSQKVDEFAEPDEVWSAEPSSTDETGLIAAGEQAASDGSGTDAIAGAESIEVDIAAMIDALRRLEATLGKDTE